MVIGDDLPPDCCPMMRRHTQGWQVKEVIHLETVDIRMTALLSSVVRGKVGGGWQGVSSEGKLTVA